MDRSQTLAAVKTTRDIQHTACNAHKNVRVKSLSTLTCLRPRSDIFIPTRHIQSNISLSTVRVSPCAAHHRNVSYVLRFRQNNCFNRFSYYRPSCDLFRRFNVHCFIIAHGERIRSDFDFDLITCCPTREKRRRYFEIQIHPIDTCHGLRTFEISEFKRKARRALIRKLVIRKTVIVLRRFY